jgi:hypothetical protein
MPERAGIIKKESGMMEEGEMTMKKDKMMK